VRVLIRAMKRIAAIAGEPGAKLRDRSRSVKFRILEIGRIARTKGGPNRERLQQGYEKLLSAGRASGRAGQAIFQPDSPRRETVCGCDAAGRPGGLAASMQRRSDLRVSMSFK
jgi:hypothetical protein